MSSPSPATPSKARSQRLVSSFHNCSSAHKVPQTQCSPMPCKAASLLIAPFPPFPSRPLSRSPRCRPRRQRRWRARRSRTYVWRVSPGHVFAYSFPRPLFFSVHTRNFLPRQLHGGLIVWSRALLVSGVVACSLRGHRRTHSLHLRSCGAFLQ